MMKTRVYAIRTIDLHSVDVNGEHTLKVRVWNREPDTLYYKFQSKGEALKFRTITFQNEVLEIPEN